MPPTLSGGVGRFPWCIMAIAEADEGISSLEDCEIVAVETHALYATFLSWSHPLKLDVATISQDSRIDCGRISLRGLRARPEGLDKMRHQEY